MRVNAEGIADICFKIKNLVNKSIGVLHVTEPIVDPFVSRFLEESSTVS